MNFSNTSFFFFFNDPATTEIYTLSLHDALPISPPPGCQDGALLGDIFGLHEELRERRMRRVGCGERERQLAIGRDLDRKSTRLNSSHVEISYAVFCLKKKNTKTVT